MDNVLSAKQSEYSLKLEKLEERRKQIEDKRRDFETRRSQQSRHIQEMESQIERYATIAHDVEQQIVEKDKTIEELRNELKKLQKQKETVQKKEKHCEIHRFLQDVIETSNQEFKHPKDIVTKFQSLNHILKELNRKQVETEASAEDKKNKITSFVESARAAIADRRLNIDRLSDEETVLQKRFYSMQKQLRVSVEENTKREIQFQQKKMSILNMTNIICKLMNRQFKTVNCVEQLNKIEHYLIDLNNIALELSGDENVTP